MIRQIRRVLPPQALTWFAVAYGLASLPMFYWLWRVLEAGVSLNHPRLPEILMGPQQLAGAVLIFFSMAYGAYRALSLHPAFRRDYGVWLASTHWRGETPLPLGPVRLVAQDGIAVSIMLLLGLWHVGWHPLYPVLMSGFAYLACLAASFWVTRQRPFGYAVLFGLAGVVEFFWSNPWAALATLTATYGVAQAGLKRAWEAFPWGLNRFGEPRSARALLTVPAATHVLGWPFERSRSEVSAAKVGVSRAEGITIGLLAGCWTWIWFSSSYRPTGPLFVLGITAIGACLARWLRYRLGHGPPINLWGRIRTLRWIIPGYDKVFVAPLTIAAIAWVGFSLLAQGHSPQLVAPAMVALMVMVGINFGPRLEDWRLTGEHRSTAPQMPPVQLARVG